MQLTRSSTLIALAALLITVTPAFAGEPEAKAGKAGEHRAKLIEKFDTNGDGKLDDSEKTAARAAFAERLSAKHPKLFARIDTDGNGVLSAEEAKAAREKCKSLKGKFDTNGDGTLDDGEKATAKVQFKEKHQNHQKAGAKLQK